MRYYGTRVEGRSQDALEAIHIALSVSVGKSVDVLEIATDGDTDYGENPPVCARS